MPTAVAALATVPCSPTCKVAACGTRPMQQACGDSPEKSAAEVNARPMPSAASRLFMLVVSASLTFGSATALVVWLVPVGLVSRAVITPRPAADGIVQPAAPPGGSSASRPSRPPRYGSQTPVQPPARSERNWPPFMNDTVTCWPAAVANGAGLVRLAWKGAAPTAR